MNTRSIRFRLTAWYAGLVTGAFAAMGLLMLWGVSHYLNASLGETQVRRARQIAQSLLGRVNQTGEAHVADEIESLYAPEFNGRFIRVTGGDGSVLYVSGAPKDQSFNPRQVPAMAPEAGRVVTREQKLAGYSPLMIGAWHFQAPDGNGFLVEVGASTASIDAMLARLKLQLLLGLAMVAAVAVGGGCLLLRRALGPVDQLARKAEQITQHNLGERLPVPRTGDELQRLSSSLNRMIARLEDAVLNAKRFGADVAHELRTPLTVLRGELQNVVQDRRLHPELRGSIGSVLEEAERLARTVVRLFTLTRLDAGEARGSWVQIDLAALAATTADHMALLAADKQISVSCEALQPVLVEGDRLRLKEVVVNLLDNAIKYTPEKGTVRLRVAAVNDHAVLEVADTGIGIPSEAVPRIFDRFSRLDKAWSRREPGGAGLGLSIVKSICTAHGGEVRVQSAPGQGTCFQVELPLACESKNHHTPA